MRDAMNDKNAPPAEIALSVVIPVSDQEAVLTRLFDRLYPVLDGLGQTYEAVFVADGSGDRSATLLRQQHKLRPNTTRVVYLRSSVGQDAAVLAGFAACVGRHVVTLDADLQCPPEEIPRLLAEMDRGHDVVGAIRRPLQHPTWRDAASRFANGLRERITGVRMADPGCMLRAFDREIVDAVLASGGTHGSISALAYRLAANPTEVVVEDDADTAADSKFPLYRLLRLNLDIITEFSLAPLRVFSMMAIGLSVASFAVVIYLLLRGLFVGAEGEGLVALFGLLFFLVGVILFGVGLLSEYIGHIVQQVSGRPQHLVREELTPRSVGRRGKG